MFDISWSELLILCVMTLIFVGPKELPRFLGMLGRYAGVIRRHAQEFRQHFEEAMREAELADIKKEVEAVRDDVAGAVSEAERSAGIELETAKRETERLARDAESEGVAQAARALDAPEPGVHEPALSDKPGDSR